METPSPSFHLMKTLLEDVLGSGIGIHAIQRHYKDSNMPAFPDSILKDPGFSFTQVNSKTVDKKNLVKRYFAGIKYAIDLIKPLKNTNDYDLIFIQSSPMSLYLILVSRIFAKHRPIIYNSQDMFPGSAIANGSMPNKLMQKVFYSLQKIAYKNVDMITAISEDMKDKLLEQNVPADKIKVIVNWYDDNAIKEIEWNKNRFVKKYNLSDDKFYVQYAGTMGTNFNPDIVLEIAQLLIEEPNIQFQMIGEGVRKNKFMKDVESLGLNNIVFYPLQPQDLVPDVYSACSICFIPLKQGVIGNSVPSKAALLMACHRVIVNSVDEDSDYGRMFEREGIGFSAGVFDSKKLAADILYLYNNPTIKKEYEDRAYNYGLREYSSSVNTRKYIELFKQMVSS